MAIIKQDNTIFNVSSDVIFTAGGKYAHSSNADASGNKFDADYFAENPNELLKSINAIEIDWNGAQTNHPTYKTLNTTGQFCALLNDLAKRVTNIENKANNINYSINITPSNLIIYTNASPSSIQLTCNLIKN